MPERRTNPISRAVGAIYSGVSGIYDSVITGGLLRFATREGGETVIRQWAETISAADAPVLDVPTGTGQYLPALPRPVAAVDLAPGMLERAKQRDGAGDAGFLRGDVYNLPFPDGAFGCAFSALGLHLMPRPRHAVAELARVVRPGGLVVGAVPVWVGAPRFPRGPGQVRDAIDVPTLVTERFERRGFLVLFRLRRR